LIGCVLRGGGLGSIRIGAACGSGDVLRGPSVWHRAHERPGIRLFDVRPSVRQEHDWARLRVFGIRRWKVADDALRRVRVLHKIHFEIAQDACPASAQGKVGQSCMVLLFIASSAVMNQCDDIGYFREDGYPSNIAARVFCTRIPGSRPFDQANAGPSIPSRRNRIP